MPEVPLLKRPRLTLAHLVGCAETLWDEQGRMQGGQDSPLTSAGRYRSTLLAADLHEEPIEAVYAGPGAGAIETARILVAGRGVGIGTRAGLREMDLGPWEGRRGPDIAKEDPDRHRAFWHRPDQYHPRGGESFAEVRERMRDCFGEILHAHRGGTVLIVSHSAALQVLLASLEGRALRDLRKAPEIRHCSHSMVQAAGIDRARIVRYAGLSWPPRPLTASAGRIASMPA
jgi:phosphoserine phosphatase